MRWEELTAPDIDALDRDATVVLLPLGSVEQHGHHLPVGTDSHLAHAVCLAAAGLTATKIVVLPPPWYGYSPHHMRFAGTVTLPAPVLIALTEAIVDSVIAHGFRRVVIVNGHGGNANIVGVIATTLGERFYGKARIAALTYFQLAREEIAEMRESRTGGMGHACEFETALMMHIHPDLVSIDRAVTLYPETGTQYLTTDLLGPSRAGTYLDFKDLSPTGTLGDPSLASSEKGARFHDVVAASLAKFIDDFARWPVDPRTDRTA